MSIVRRGGHMRILLLFIIIILSIFTSIVSSTTFTFINKCVYTVWPGILSGAGSSNFPTTGFEVQSGTSSKPIQSPIGWSGRFWGRTGCTQNPTTNNNFFSCLTADCGTGSIECNGHGATPPATLAEFTLTGGSGATQDFYDVSLVDGYNLPLIVEAASNDGGDGVCGVTGCVTDLNLKCPVELRSESGGAACRSACEVFGKDEYCCSGEYASPDKCKASVYSEVFKSVCPKAYSYAFDDASSTFTCPGGADYTITFCPSSSSSQKSTMDQPIGGGGEVNASGSGSGSQPAGTAVLADGSWLGDLANSGGSMNPVSRWLLFAVVLIIITLVIS